MPSHEPGLAREPQEARIHGPHEARRKEASTEMMQRIEKDLTELGTIEQVAKMEGKQLTMVIAPKKRK